MEETFISLSALCRVIEDGTEEFGEGLMGMHFWSIPLPDGVRPLQRPACQHQDHQGHPVPLGGRSGMTGQVEDTLQETPPTMIWGAV